MKKMYVKTWTELTPHIDGRKSFYKKAHVGIVMNDNNELLGFVLKSYNTNVCFITNDGNIHKLWDGYSVTTMRHIHDFIYQFAGKNSGGKKEWEQMPTYDDYMFIESA